MCLLVNSTYGPKTLPGARMHQGGAGVLCATLTMALRTLETDEGSFGWRRRGCVCTVATSPRTILSRYSRVRFFFLRKASAKLMGGSSLRVTSIVSRPSGEKPARIGGEY